MSHQESINTLRPPLPARWTRPSQTSPGLPTRPSGQGSGFKAHETHPGFSARITNRDFDEDDFVPPQDHESFARRDSSMDPTGRPPRHRLTTGDVPINRVGYARNPQHFVGYLIPLPAPTHKGQKMNVPQRYMLYTPPAPHLLKPVDPNVKEAKRHKLKRFAQQELKKAKTYDGRTISLRGLHSKTLRGMDWVVGAIKSADITFFSRVPRKEVNELILIHPASVLAHQSPEDVHKEFTDQLARTKHRAAKHSVISVALFVPGIVIDTLAAVVWPFGGLAEIDGVWAYASISAWLTARSVSRRLHNSPERSDGDGILTSRGTRSRTGSRTEHVEEDSDDEDVRMRGDRKENGTRNLKIRFVLEEAMVTMERYLQEILHKQNPRAFPSPGLPPTKTDVLASIGWWPDTRGRSPGSQQEGDWDDENWQTRQVKEDMDKVMRKSAKQWDRFCKAYAKYPQRAMKEKGHSRTSGALRKLRGNNNPHSEQKKPAVDNNRCSAS